MTQNQRFWDSFHLTEGYSHYEVRANGLRFDVSVENAVSMHMLNSFQDLESLKLHFAFWDVILATIDGVIQVTIHQLENEGQTPSWFIVQHLVEADDVWVRGQSLESLNFSQVLDLFNRMEVIFHALDGNVFSGLDRLSFQHFWECSFALLGY